MARDNIATEKHDVVELKGSPKNPGRDPKVKSATEGTIGDIATKDALILVGLAWAILVVLALSLRSVNI